MHTIGMAVMSADGCLTRHAEAGTGFASEADQRLFRETLGRCDCVVMGGAAFRAARARIVERLDEARLRVVLTRRPEDHRDDARPGRLEFRADAPAAVLRDLAVRGFQRCAVVGGARTLTDALGHGLLDELWLTVEPVLFGTGARLVDGAVEFPLDLQGVERLGADTVLLRYRPARRPRR
ncbi:MAG: dihydrofolate reductase family protein [Gemmatimonadetes bacterium]|nr:dihydrofolate reductase family protein [Gemmatimonadota bacterium]MCC7132924.1 dihydrofolate reductase family protein [Gemmatimonadales bacterium]